MEAPGLDRRRVLVGTGLAGSAAVLSACGVYAQTDAEPAPEEALRKGDPEPPAAVPDIAILVSLLEVERGLVAGYSDVVPRLDGEVQATARGFLRQEREHAGRLEQLIRKLGGTVPKEEPPSSYLGSLPQGAKGLELLTAAEQEAVAEYADGLAGLRDERIRQVVASIVTNEAEHITVLLAARRMDPLPEAFVTGALTGKGGKG